MEQEGNLSWTLLYSYIILNTDVSFERVAFCEIFYVDMREVIQGGILKLALG